MCVHHPSQDQPGKTVAPVDKSTVGEWKGKNKSVSETQIYRALRKKCQIIWKINEHANEVKKTENNKAEHYFRMLMILKRLQNAPYLEQESLSKWTQGFAEVLEL